MSRSSKSTHLLTVGLIAAATVCLLVYVNNQGATAKSSKKGDTEEKAGVKPAPSTAKKAKTVDTKKASLDATPKRSNVTDQKELHSKIEELDKKGKALFKSKKVRLRK